MANPSILITQCLQNDFVASISVGESLPNLLHIGHEESQRLLGLDDEGPIGQIINWAEAQPQSRLECIHVRDWHDVLAPDQKSHLEHFGPHCLADTYGAQFIFSFEKAANKHIVSSTTLNDFDDTVMPELLDRYKGEPIRVGIIGVWTEAKILFLAYELATRYPSFQLSVCSALTASSSRSQHFYALEQLKRIVGVKVIESLGEFVEFLGGNMQDSLPNSFNHSLEISNANEIALKNADEQLLRYLFRECKSLKLRILDGGFSGNLVAGAHSIDLHGQGQAPHVVKIGPRQAMAHERTAFEQIEGVLGNNAPAIADYADLEDRGAIKYRYASMGSEQATTFQAAYQQGAKIDFLEKTLTDVFGDQLGRFYRAATRDKLDLFEYYCFDSSWAGSIKNKISHLIGQCPDEGELSLPLGATCLNLYKFYREELDQLSPTVGDYPVSYVHGDLNGANIIIDAKDNVWLIDFFHTHRGHVLKDFAKFENDLLYIASPCDDDVNLEVGYRFIDFLLGNQNPLVVQPLPAEFKQTPYERTYRLIQRLRTIALSYMDQHEREHLLEWLVAQMRYSVHTIGFDEPNERQRLLALYTSANLASKIKSLLSNT